MAKLDFAQRTGAGDPRSLETKAGDCLTAFSRR
jgi:hypothetical protein